MTRETHESNTVKFAGWTALHEAIVLSDGEPEHQEVLRLLIKAGADVNLPDRQGVRPLSLARQRSQTEMTEILEQAGANPAGAQASPGLWLTFVILIGLNLRPFLTSSGTLARQVAQGLNMPLSSLAWLTLLPMMVMGAFCMPSLRRLLALRHVLMTSLLLLCLGCVLRWFVPNGASLIATALVCVLIHPGFFIALGFYSLAVDLAAALVFSHQNDDRRNCMENLNPEQPIKTAIPK